VYSRENEDELVMLKGCEEHAMKVGDGSGRQKGNVLIRRTRILWWRRTWMALQSLHVGNGPSPKLKHGREAFSISVLTKENNII